MSENRTEIRDVNRQVVANATIDSASKQAIIALQTVYTAYEFLRKLHYDSSYHHNAARAAQLNSL